MNELGDVVPLRFDMSDMVRKSVATLYSHLVTRPTGQALRLGIEAQITELGALCLTVLDFSEVVVLDYSCADETIAKLIQRFQRSDRPAEAYFIARGIDDRHLETIDSVLSRQDLAIAAEIDGGEITLLGGLSDAERVAWTALGQISRGSADDVARVLNETGTAFADEAEEHLDATRATLESLARRRVIARMDIPRRYFALRSLITDD